MQIRAELDDINHSLLGFMELEYTNHSPDTLTFIWFHLWPNAYKNNRTALARQLMGQGKTWAWFARSDARGYIDSLRMEVNGAPATLLPDSQYADIARLLLPAPLLPGQTIRITSPFYVKIPSARISRFGHQGQDYYITQWYPKPAVYDRFGWHPMPYLDQGEFYSEFGRHELYITLPKNYLVAATGELQNEEEKAWLEEKVRLTEASGLHKRMKIPWAGDTSTGRKTLHFTADRVHDMAWFASKERLVKHSVTTLPSGRQVDCWSFFKPQNAWAWWEANDDIAGTLQFYSRRLTEYPYNTCTAFDGDKAAGVDMEYPMLTLIGRSNWLGSVLTHEVGHNWFYGILANNERDHAWMDEGLNSFMERQRLDELYPEERVWSSPDFLGIRELPERLENYYDYLPEAREQLDQPIDLTSSAFTASNYGAVVYSKTTVALYYLQAYLGDTVFDGILKRYAETWAFRHPSPDDFEDFFRKNAPKPVDWFFNDLVRSDKKIDYAIVKGHVQGDEMILTVRNRGTSDAPFPLGYTSGQDSILQWEEGFFGEREITVPLRSGKQLAIDPGQVMPDINRKNNFIRTSGNLRQVEKFRLQLGTSIENPHLTQLFFFPTLGWNRYNEGMAGLAIYNISLTPKKFEFILNPMFALGTASFTGNAEVSYRHYPQKGKLQTWKISLPFSRFGYSPDSLQPHYIRLAPTLTMEFKKKNSPGRLRHQLLFSSCIIFRELPSNAALNRDLFTLITARAEYRVQRKHALLPVYARGVIEFISEPGMNFQFSPVNVSPQVKFSAEAGMKWIYYRRNRGISVRLFAGAFLTRGNTVGDYRFRLSGQAGYQDYTFSDYYFGRSETSGFLSQQMAHTDGDFKTFTFIGQTSEWLVTLNLKAQLPVVPVSFFFDIGTYAHAGSNFPGAQAVVFDGGICIDVWPDILEIYFPLFMSSDIKNSVELNTQTYWERIRFMINLRQLDPIRRSREFFR